MAIGLLKLFKLTPDRLKWRFGIPFGGEVTGATQDLQ